LGVFPEASSNFHREVKKDEAISFNVQVKDDLEPKNLSFELHTEHKALTFEADSMLLKDGKLKLYTTFSKRGLYDLHLKSGEDYLCTYILKVK
tara:strand:+ start:6352 stop:6630 length:279 start_codon:yes stop_codon:yes gene_type:complete